MRIQEPLTHWNNFTIPELKEILNHCTALERLGIAQDQEMMTSIQRDIALREKTISPRLVRLETKPKEVRSQPTERLLEQVA